MKEQREMSAPAVHPRTLVSWNETISARLRQAGFDLMQGFPIAANDPLFREEWAKVLFPPWAQVCRESGRLCGIIVGNSIALWDPFRRWLSEQPRRKHLPNPLDCYVQSMVEAAVADASSDLPQPQRVWIGYGHHTNPLALPIQRVAELSGLAALGPVGLVIHREFGPWLALRALILVEGASPLPIAEYSQNKELCPSGPRSPCHGCSAPCVEAFEQAKNGVGAPSAPCKGGAPVPPTLSNSSRRWLAVRDACPLGTKHRYGLRQISYHYDKTPEALEPDEACP